MFGQMGQLMSLLGKTDKIKEEFAKLLERLDRMTVEGQAGGGMVTVTLTGKFNVKSCRLSEEALALKDKEMLEHAAFSAANFGLTVQQPQVDRYIREGEQFSVGASELSVRYTPGHCPGHIILVGDGFALVGDVVFAGSVGRTDFPGTSWDVLSQSIKRELFTLPDETILFPGHGPSTTIGRERSTNPFLQDL